MALLKRHKDSHKGDNGVVLVVGGSEIYSGAPAFTSLAAYRTGVDIVYTATPRRAADIVATFSPEMITIPLLGKFLDKMHIPVIEEYLEKVDVLAIGPGLGTEKYTMQACRDIISKCNVPMVIDADALKALAGNLKILKNKECVLTPHRGEFEIISGGQKAVEENVRKFTAGLSEKNIVTVLKAPVDIITDGHRIKKNTTGNPGMTIGGTGDTLTGIVAALIAQKVNLFDAACNAAFINGKAGDLCFSEKGCGLITSDIIEKIPEIIKNL
ncbi:TPA: NAD(P)H-hydrate dehydratase [archaeon]|uniref:ADP-dependent (S)-NAD(P)H-hydrate dehydratase n=1 Tax=Candidatus Naiadarchaeum limnaeum TaxID=2756139 RepID=A0A832V2Q1_9ARCH|nr:NAD(P)H-hydrate dehydratase [Candidatus Naiadarchaeales archaeon SRR2090153.bin1042]HIK00881.1 NAD(P)H-hydrate dehydratase [Candidatus Naiadarchaeum limnaeum]